MNYLRGTQTGKITHRVNSRKVFLPVERNQPRRVARSGLREVHQVESEPVPVSNASVRSVASASSKISRNTVAIKHTHYRS